MNDLSGLASAPPEGYRTWPLFGIALFLLLLPVMYAAAIVAMVIVIGLALLF